MQGATACPRRQSLGPRIWDWLMRFENREEAGRLLADRLGAYREEDGVVLALPRGGVPVALPVAQALGMPLDLVFVRKVGLPGHEELALAAIAGSEGEELVVNQAIAASGGYGPERIAELAEPQRAELRRRRKTYGAPGLALTGKLAFVVDDGIATGATMRAAAQALRKQHPRRLVLAVPVAPPEAISALRDVFDDILCLSTPSPFIAVGSHYTSFPQVEDAEVTRLLSQAAPPA